MGDKTLPEPPMRALKLRSPSLPAAPEIAFPAQPLRHLDALWIQVAGTLCNLTCTHCFVSAGPANHRHALMSRDEVATRVAEGLELGVKELYFTGGEPFLHPEMSEILGDNLALAPCTVLTNGTRFTPALLGRLRELSAASRYSLELRVSLDGASPQDHDAFRGHGAFSRVMEGLRRCEAHGLLPIATVTQTDESDPVRFCERWLELLRSHGVRRPRLKRIPLFRLGREATRTRAYLPAETLAGLAPEAFDETRLQCGSCRAVTARGVYPCPLLVEEPGGRMGDTLEEARAPFELRHGACYTCYVTGMTCGNG